MSEEQDEKLTRMLHSRRIDPASENLAARIILKAQSLPQVQNLSLWQAVRQLFAEFHLPRPAYVLAGALIFGFVVGYTAPQNTTPTDDADSLSVQSFLNADEDEL